MKIGDFLKTIFSFSNAKKHYVFHYFAIVLFILNSCLGYSQVGKVFVPRLPGGNMRIKGDVIFVGNSMVSATTYPDIKKNTPDPRNVLPVFSAADPNGIPTNLAALTAEANKNYDVLINNNGLNQEYVDIDTDPTTFASSSAQLNINNTCKRIVYAGLYWTAIYPYERSTNSGSNTVGTPRLNDWNQIKFKIPGAANYTTLVADNAADPVGDEDEIIFDGYKAPPASSFTNTPYVCYKNVTNMLQALTDPNGNYFAANIRAAKGKKSSGSMAGWTLVIVYESPTLPSRFISTFDGFAGITSALKNLDFTVNGFKTLPAPLPVRATIGVAAQEGEAKLFGDDLLIKANTVAGFTFVNNSLNPLNNVFNSSITVPTLLTPFSANVSTRVPNSLNTLGFDMDLINVNNPNNGVVPNNETGATYRLTSTSDTYAVYVTTFAVDVIEPEIVLTKIVKNAAGVNIGNTNVTLGDFLNYEIGFKNVGNDDADSFTIKDILPVNILFDPNNIVVPNGSGITFTYTPATRTIIFTVPNNLVKINGNQWIIKFGVQVVPNCNDLSDACADQVKNQAFGTYKGVTNPSVITDDPSISVFGSCNLATPSATNFLVGVSGCKYTRKYQLCGANVTISAANGYDKYSWSTSPTGSPVIGTTQSINVSTIGTYYVHNTALAPCVSIDETVTVGPFGTTVVNPITPFADEIVKCPNDGKLLPNIYLCGDNAKRFIRTGITDTNSIIWEKSSCGLASGTLCADETNGCTWTQIATGPDYNLGGQGQYRITLNYTNGCFSRYFFNVYENKLNPTATSRDIICNTTGEIVVGTPAAGSGYEYSLDGITYQASNILPINSPNIYTVYIRSTVNTPNRCVFTIPGIQIRKRDFTVATTITNPFCYGGKGAIKLAANDVRAQYFFSISKGGTLINSVGPINPNDYTFSNLDPGTYDVKVSTEDGCLYNGTATLIEPAILTATAAITKPLTCESGEITVTPVGGTGPYTYFVNSPTDFGGSPVISITTAGTYTIRVVDFNNCEYTIAPITITDNPKPIYTVTSTNVKCYGSSNGEIKFNVTNANGYSLSYSIDNGTTYVNNDTFSTLPTGTYTAILKYSLGGVDCFDAPQTIVITEPSTALTASAGVSELAGCGDGIIVPKNNGKIRITNPQGGTPFPAPDLFLYSFDNQVTWITANDAYKAPGTYTVYIKDANGCIFAMPGVIIDPEPVAPTINVNTPVDFNCDGTATSKVIINNPGSASYSYDYFLDNVKNTNTPSNEFINVPVGTHAVRVEYKLTSVPTYSNLLFENFGYGDDTTSPGMNAVYYCFERQVVATQCKGSTAINDGDYSVTAKIVNPFGAWIQPGDHTLATVPPTPKGRCLVVNIGDKIPVTEILYEKVINNIIPNQPINAEFFAMNLLNKSNTQFDPDLRVALVDAAGTEISWYNTGNIPKSEKWENYPKTPITLNPGTNTTLKFIVRSNVQQTSGNDVAIDDIKVYQLPKSCITTKDFTIVVPTGKAFTGSITGFKNAKCNGANNGEITIAAQNFGASFQYSIDNGATWTTSPTSPVTIPNLAATTYNIKIRPDATSAVACTKPFTQIIAAPVAIGASTTVTTLATCSTGATITTTATGGTPAYEYELRNAAGVTVITAYQSSNKFTNVPAGSYTIFVRDANLCSNPVGVPVTVVAPTAVTASLAGTSDLCYDTIDQAKLVVTATGTGTLTYQLDSNAAQGSNTFTNVGPGNHTIIVTDSNNCTATISNIIIATQLLPVASVTKTLDCSATPDAVITVNIAGGTAPYKYTVQKGAGAISAPSASNPALSFTYSVSNANADTYTFVVTDAIGCSATTKATVNPITNPTVTPTPTQVSCNGGTDGTVQLVGAGGSGGYTYSFDGSAFTSTSLYTGLKAGIAYSYLVKDSKGCVSIATTISLTEPTTLVATASATAFSCSTTNTKQSAVVTIAVPTTGTPVYQYSFNGGGYTNTNTLTLNDNGTDQVVNYSIKDGKGCITAVKTITVNKLNPPTDLTFTPSGLVTCTTTTTNVTLVATNGVGTLSYQITSPVAGLAQASATFTGLLPNTYIFKVTDANGCYYTESYVVAPVTPIAIAGNVDLNVNCKGDSTGKATYTVSGNATVGAYSFLLTAGTLGTGTLTQAGDVLTLANVKAGSYTVQVTDTATGCVKSATVNITEPAVALSITSATATNVNCNNDNSQITIVAANGTPNYTYAFAKSPSVIPTSTYGGSAVLTVDTNSAADLVWDVYVKDANGCVSKSTVTVVSDALPKLTSVVVNNQCTGSGSSFTITATGTGLAPLSYSINGTTFQSSNVFSVAAGTYTVSIKDKNGCIVPNATPTIVYPQLTTSAAVTKTLDCSASPDAVITTTITGGKSLYTYTVQKGLGVPSAASAASAALMVTYPVSNANADTYTFVVTDANGCTSTSKVTVNPITNPTVSETHVNPLCNGNANGSVQLLGAGGSGGYKYSNDNITFVSSGLFTGLAAGTHTFYVKDSKGCSGTVNAILTDPVTVGISAVVTTPLSCSATNTKVAGLITVTGSGGTGTYTYSFNNGTSFSGSNTLTVNDNGLTQSFNIFVKDGNGCVSPLQSISLAPLNPPVISNISHTDIYCAPVASTTSTVTVTKTAGTGVGLITYEIIAPIVSATSNTTGVFTGLGGGVTYTFKVKDANGCFAISSHNVPVVTPIAVTGTKLTDVDCFGNTTGSIRYNVSGFGTTYSYSVNGAAAITGQNAAIFTLPNLGANTYSVVFTDETTQCTQLTSIIITQPAATLSATFTQINANCNVATSKVTVTPAGGTASYTYAYKQDGVAPLATDYVASNIGNLNPTTNANWDIWVKDAKGCTVKLDVAIVKDALPNVTASVTNQCSATGSSFTIVAVGASGVGPYTYSINTGVAPSPANTFTVAPGTYTITVKDANSCTNIVSVTVNQALTATAIVTKDITCSIPQEATIKVDVLGGIAPFGYRVKIGAGTFSGLPIAFGGTSFNYPVVSTIGDTYQFEITDANGTPCTTLTNVVTTNTPAIVTATETHINPTCNGFTDGSIKLTATAGVSPFTYSIDNGATFVNSNVFGGLLGGVTYNYVVRDAKGCDATGSINLINPPAITPIIGINGIQCNSVILGSFDVSVSLGGTAPYVYRLYDNSFNQIATYTEASSAVTPIHNFGGLNFGDYYITITDAKGCEFKSSKLRIQPTPYLNLGLVVNSLSCATGVSVTVSVSGGVPNYTYSIFGQPATSSGPTPATSYIFNGLDQNTKYVFEVIDINGCPSYLEFTTPTISPIIIDPVVIKNVTCNSADDGEITFTVTNYDVAVTDLYYELRDNLTNVAIIPAKNGTATGLTGAPFTGSLTGLKAGNYTLYVKETNGTLCSAVYTFVITQPLQPLASAITSVVNANCNSGALVTLTTTGGTGPYTYAYAVSPAVPSSFNTGNVLNLDYNLGTNWNIIVKDFNGCKVNLGQIISKDPSPVIALSVVDKCVSEGTFGINVSETTAGTGVYSISVDGGAFNSIAGLPYVVTGLNSGPHTIIIKDANGCTDTKLITIDKPLELTPAIDALPTCADNDGQITLTGLGGTGSYTYTILPMPATAVITGNVISGLAANTYTVTMTDTATPIACSITASVTLIAPTPVTFATVVNNATCNGLSDGVITVNLLAGNDNPSYTYEITAGPTTRPVQPSNVFTGLAAGIYTVRVNSGRGCSKDDTNVVVGQPLVLTATSLITTPLTCGAANVAQPATVTVTVTPGTGTAPYEYSFDGGTSYSSVNTYQSFVGTTFDVYVKDANGCIFTLVSGVNIPALVPPTNLTFNSTIPVTCLVSGTVDITGHTGGVGILQYETIAPSPIIVPQQTTTTFAGLTPGTYLFQVTDANGCTYQESYAVNPVTNITVSGQLISDVTCNPGNNGEVLFTVANFGTTYSYTINAGAPILAQNSSTITISGITTTSTQTIVVTDEVTGCTATTFIDVAQPAPLALTANPFINANCNNGAQVSVTATGGVAPYSYSYVVAGNPAGVYSTSNATVLDPGTSLNWDVWVKDANNCVITTPLTIAIIKDVSPTIVMPTAQCFTGSPLTIDLSIGATIPVGPATYTINGSNQAGSLYTITAPGTYHLSIVDANGCPSNIVDYVVQPQLTLVADMTQDLTCIVDANIVLTPTGGTGTYVTYEVDINGGGYNPIAGSPYTATAPGNYTFRVTDNQVPACPAISNTVTVTPKTLPTFTTTQTNVTCIGGADGIIVVSAGSGIAPYQYSKDNGATYQASNVFTGLNDVGVYNIVVKDSKDCPSAATLIDITEPTAITASAAVTTGLTCGAANATQAATVTVTASGGTGTLEYSFDGGVNYSTTNTYTTNLAGLVSALVKDANGCVIAAPVSANVLPLNPPINLDFNATAVTCLATTSNVTLTPTNGVGILSYTILPAIPVGVTQPVANEFDGLLPGTYLFQVTDGNGCTYQESYTVDPVTPITVSGELVSDVTCNPGANGEVKFTVSNFGTTYSYTINGGAAILAQNSPTITISGITATSTQTIVVTDEVTGCTATTFINVTQPAALALSANPFINANCNNGAQVSVTATGGVAPYNYSYVVAGNPAGTYSTSNATVLDPGISLNWDVWVKDANNCVITTPLAIAIVKDPLPSVIVNPYSQCPSLTGDYTFTLVAAGKGPFEYSIGSGFQTSATFTVNTPGIYNVTVKDVNTCETTVNGLVNILTPLALTPTITTTPSCAGNDGVITVVATGGSANYTYNIDGGAFVATTVFNFVTPGLHTMGVHDVTTLCDVFVPITLTPATPITGFALAMTPVSCNGGGDGTITATLATPSPGVNDNPVYMYSLNGGTPQASNLFSGLAAGVYTVDVVSARGCKASLPKTVIQPNPIVLPAATVAQYGCATGNVSNYATITIDPLAITGGTTPYLNYEFIKNGTPVYLGANNSYTEADLLGGSYVVKVYDSNGCVGSTIVPIVIKPYIALDKVNVVVHKAITCTNLEDITVTVTTIGGTPSNIEYTLVDTNATTGINGGIYPQQTNTIGVFTGLPVADYLITVKNLDTNCEIQDVHYVNEPNTFDLTIDNIVDVTCLNGTNGSANVTFIDRVITATDLDQAGSFNYTIVDALGNTLPGGSSATAGPIPLTGLAAGTYTVSASLINTPFCSVSRSFTITGPAAALTVIETHSEITCVSADSGTISATATGGWPGGYEFELVGPVNVAYSPNSNFTNLTAGNYTINVRDAKGCVDTKLLKLNNPTPITFAAAPSTLLLTCNGDTSASITVGVPTGGQGSNYLYTLNKTSVAPVISSGPQNSNVFANLGAGTYTITVSDGWGCSTTSAVNTIAEPNVVVASLVKTSTQTCTVQATLTLSATGGTGLYSFSTTPNFAVVAGTFATSITFSVPVGTYRYYVRDANGCISVVSNDIQIDPLPTLNVAVDIVNSKINCKGDSTGVIIASATGGLGNYVYTLLNGAGLPLAFVPTQLTAGNFTQLPAGAYIVHVNSGDCQVNSVVVTIQEPLTSLKFTYSKTDVKCSGNGDGSITVNGFDGSGIIKYSITPRSDKFLDTGLFTGLKPGLYTVIIQDQNGCYLLQDVTIAEPLPIDAKVDPLSIKQELCAGEKTGEFAIVITPGSGTAPYSTSLDDPKGTYVLGQVLFTGLSGGNHIVYIKDANSCTFELPVALNASVILNPTAVVSNECVNDLPANKVTVTIDASNIPADVKYYLDASTTENGSNVFVNLSPGDHYIMVHHKNGCDDATPVFTIDKIDPLAITLDLGGLNEIVATVTGGSSVYQFTVNGVSIGSNNKYIYFKSGNYTVTVTDSNGCVASATKYFEFIDIVIPPIFTPTGDGTYDTWKPTNTENYPDIKFVVYDRYGRVVGTFGAGQSWDGKYNGAELPMGDYWYVLKLRHNQDDREFMGHFTLYR